MVSDFVSTPLRRPSIKRAAQSPLPRGTLSCYTHPMIGPWKRFKSKADSRPAFGVQHPARDAGFSLIEMLITLALLLIMVTMFWGFGSRSHQEEQKKACQKNLQKIHVALEIFANDNGGGFPVSSN